jgi:hypothetical protein
MMAVDDTVTEATAWHESFPGVSMPMTVQIRQSKIILLFHKQLVLKQAKRSTPILSEGEDVFQYYHREICQINEKQRLCLKQPNPQIRLAA